jgi:hypothetical protein
MTRSVHNHAGCYMTHYFFFMGKPFIRLLRTRDTMMNREEAAQPVTQSILRDSSHLTDTNKHCDTRG